MTEKQIADEIQRSLRPYIEENVHLNRRIDALREEIAKKDEMLYQRSLEITRLKEDHSKSGLERDKPQPRLWTKKNGLVINFCPVCHKMVSNWESYCCVCGQKLDTGNLLDKCFVKVEENGEFIPAKSAG